MNQRIIRRSLLLFASLLALGTPAVAQEPGGENGSVSEAFERLGHRPLPDAYGDEEAREAKELHDSMAADRERILKPGSKLSREEVDALAARFAPKMRRLEELRVQRLQWEAFQKNPESEWWRATEPDVPVLGPAAADTSVAVDLLEFYWLLKRFQSLQYLSLRPEVNAPKHGLPEPSAAEARDLARRFEACTRGRIELGAGSTKGSYRLRAACLQGRCLLIAAWHYRREQNEAEADRAWEEAIDVLHRADVVFKTAERTGVDLEPLNLLPPIEGEHIKALKARHKVTLRDYEWNEDTHRIGSRGRPGSQAATSDVVRHQLAQNCPWGVPIFHFLKDQGMTDGIDLTILRGQAFGPGEKVWVRNVGPASIPASVREDIDELRKGNFTVGGQPFNVEWEAVQGANDLSVWYVSPTVTDMSAGAWLGILSKTVTVAKCGLIGIAADILGDLAGMAFEELWPDNAPLQIATGVLAEANKWEFDEAWNITTEDVSGMDMLKGGLLKVLDAVEKAEMEELFDGIDPAEGRIAKALGGQTTYDGSWMPPVILRAVITGHEKVSDAEYKRLWIVTKYWALDPRGLSGDGDKPWDLSEVLVSELQGAAGYRAGQVETSRRTWWPLPDAKKNVGWGSRVRVIGLAPEYQWLNLVVEPEVEKEWRAACSENEAIAYVLRFPPPEQNRVDYAELGNPIAFHNIEFRKGDSVTVGGFKERKLYCEYDLRIVRAPRSSDYATIDVNSPQAVELARMPVRFVNKKGSPPTGELKFYESYSRVDQIVRYEGSTDRAFDLDPSTDGLDPIPPALVLRGGPKRDSNVYGSRSAYDTTFDIECAYGPAKKDTWYKLIVTVEHPSYAYPHQYVLYDKVLVHSGSAYFRGEAPVPPGMSKIKLEVPGLDTKSILYERLPPQAKDPIDLAQEEKYERKKLEERGRAKNQYQALSAHRSIIDSKIGLANRWAERERYGSARDLLHQVAKLWPDLRQIKDERQRRSYYNSQERYLEILVKVTYHQGDVETLSRELPNWLHRKRETLAGKIRTGSRGYDNDDYEHVARTYDKWIDRLLILGGSPEAAAPLIAEWKEMRRLCGKARPDLDSRRFRHPGLMR